MLAYYVLNTVHRSHRSIWRHTSTKLSSTL